MSDDEEFSVCITSEEYSKLQMALRESQNLQKLSEGLQSEKRTLEKKCAHIQLQWEQDKFNLAELREKLAKLDQAKDQIAELKECLQRLTKENNALKAELAQKDKEIKEKSQQSKQDYEQMNTKLCSKLKQMQKLTDLNNNLSEEVAQLQELNAEFKDVAVSYETKFTKLSEQHETLRNTIKSQKEADQKQLAELTAECSKTKEIVAKYQASISNYSKQMEAKDLELKELKQNLMRLQSLPTPLKQGQDQSQLVKNIKAEMEQREVIINVMDSQLKAMKMRYQQLSSEYKRIQQTSKESEVEKKVVVLQEKICRLEAKLNNKYQYLNNYYKDLHQKLSHFNPAQKSEFIKKDLQELVDYLSERLHD